MLFNSINYALFLPLVFLFYWFVTYKSLKLQNLLLLASSYFFYGFWDWRFLFLLLFSTVLDYFTGIKMADAKSQIAKKSWFWLSISVNLGFLAVFKYYNFFTESFVNALSHFGLTVAPWTLNLILPVGISFYTFHGLSYVIDIYKGRIHAEKDFVAYSVFVSFFPLLIAGPIERATHLLPQIKKERVFDYNLAVEGLKQILWGLVKKVVIADQCAVMANLTFNNPEQYSGSTLLLGAVFFAFQIYGDFSGYSDIALGTAKLFGIQLLNNFAFPYFSRDIAEFWRRWHISLSSWFRDYLYIPLGGSKVGIGMKIRNTLLIFLISGFWHGANWTFLVWGLLNALYILPSILFKTNRNHLDIVAKGKTVPSIKELISMLLTFGLTVFAWIFFRASSLTHALEMIRKIFSSSFFQIPEFHNDMTKPTIVLVLLFMTLEWLGREQAFAISKLGLKLPKLLRWTLYYILIIAVLCYSGSEQQFIYFQF